MYGFTDKRVYEPYYVNDYRLPD